MVPNLKLQVLDDAGGLAQVAATQLAVWLQEAIDERGEAHWALAGGATPVPVYERLAGPALRDAVDWRQVHCWWTDERWVSSDDPLSNQGMARTVLLDRLPLRGDRVHAIDVTTKTPQAAALDYERLLHRSFGESATFDVVLLGIGEDGHVASLFPCSPLLNEPTRWVVVESRAPKPPAVRISLSLLALRCARHHLVLARGRAKAAAIQRLRHDPAGDLPIERVLTGAADARGFVDAAAAGVMPRAPPAVGASPSPEL